MNVDAKATKAARARHEKGRRQLDELFGFTPAKAPFIPKTGRRVGVSRGDRVLWRTFLDKANPKRVRTRRRRKIANASRRRNRR